MPENSFERRVAAKQEDDETPVKRRVADDTAFERRVAAKREDVEVISECEVEYEGAVFYESPKSEQEHETSEPDESVKAEVDSEVEHEAKSEDDNATEIADLSNVADFLSKEVMMGKRLRWLRQLDLFQMRKLNVCPIFPTDLFLSRCMTTPRSEGHAF